MADEREGDRLLEGAEEWLAAARSEAEADRRRVAYELARHAAELSCKAILLRALGSYPKTHDVSGLLAQHGLLPPDVTGRRLSRLLGDFTSGTYGFERELSRAALREAIDVAERCLAAAR